MGKDCMGGFDRSALHVAEVQEAVLVAVGRRPRRIVSASVALEDKLTQTPRVQLLSPARLWIPWIFSVNRDAERSCELFRITAAYASVKEKSNNVLRSNPEVIQGLVLAAESPVSKCEVVLKQRAL